MSFATPKSPLGEAVSENTLTGTRLWGQAGLDSLAAVELRSEIASRFGISVPATLAFDYPTLDAMARFVEQRKEPAETTHDTSLFLDRPATSKTKIDNMSMSSQVLGIAARYPGKPGSGGPYGVKSFWASIMAGVDLQRVVPGDRWDIDSCYSPVPDAGKMYVRFGCFVDGVAEFDAQPFRLGPADAVGLDPQARILLEQVAEVVGSIDVPARTGVYVGCMYTEYLDSVLGPLGEADRASQAIVGHGLSFLVGRVSFTFGLQGPCVSTDTACSSSLVALHLANQVIHLLLPRERRHEPRQLLLLEGAKQFICMIAYYVYYNFSAIDT